MILLSNGKPCTMVPSQGDRKTWLVRPSAQHNNGSYAPKKRRSGESDAWRRFLIGNHELSTSQFFFAAETHPRGWSFYFSLMSWEHT